MKFLLLCLPLIICAFTAHALEIKPKTKIRFFCAADGKSLFVTDGNEKSLIKDYMVDWTSGTPKPACDDKVIGQITDRGFFCNGKYLTDFKGKEELFMSPKECLAELSKKPRIDWN